MYAEDVMCNNSSSNNSAQASNIHSMPEGKATVQYTAHLRTFCLCLSQGLKKNETRIDVLLLQAKQCEE